MSLVHNSLYSHVFAAMGSRCEIVLEAGSELQAKRLFELAEVETIRIEKKYSRYLNDSWLSQVNQSAGMRSVTLDEESFKLLEYAQHLYDVSTGFFDITSGILRHAWNFKVAPSIPKQDLINQFLDLIDWPSVEWSTSSIYLPKRGMEIDFGGYGKEYAADRVYKILQDERIKVGYINFAGDMRIIGPRQHNEPWQMGIQNPRSSDALIATIPLFAGALATSGDYERFFEIDGHRYCHIINPKNGQPVTYWRSISVLAPTALMAGSYSTIAMLLEDKGLEFLNQSKVPYLAIDKHGAIHKKSSEMNK